MAQKLKKILVVLVLLSTFATIALHFAGCGSGVDFGVTEFTITGAGQ